MERFVGEDRIDRVTGELTSEGLTLKSIRKRIFSAYYNNNLSLNPLEIKFYRTNKKEIKFSAYYNDNSNVSLSINNSI